MILLALLLRRIEALEALVVALLARRRRPSAETRAKISRALLDRRASDETRARMSEAKRNRKLSEEHKQRISEGKRRARKDKL